MNTKSRRIGMIIIIALVFIAAGALGWRWWKRSHNTRPDSVLVASGTIEAEEVEVASELGGRVITITVEEGDEIRAGQILLQLDAEFYQAQLEQALAAVDVAQANLDRAEMGATPEEKEQARAALNQATAARNGAYQIWRAAQAVADNPQQAIAQYRAALGAADSAAATVVNVEQSGGAIKENARLLWYNAANVLRDAQANYSRIYWRNREQEKERELTQAEKDEEDSAWRRVEDTERDMQIAETNYNLAQTTEAQNNVIAQTNWQTTRSVASDLGGIVDDPLSVEAQVAQARAQYEQAQGAVQVAQAALNRVEAGASEPEIEICRGQLRQAQAAAGLLQLELDRTTLRAPVGGIVLTRSIHAGELAAPGLALLTIGDLDTVRLTIYIAEDVYGQVRLNQQVRVLVDSYPGRSFSGQVVYISPQAEFTPKDVQTAQERVNLVYAVRVRLDNPEHLLKPGMPADAEILMDN